MLKKISIIIPIWNTEAYIEKCLTSIKKQSYENFEVLMIDDGSTDNTSFICKSIENIDSRFHYFYKENGGSSSARNMGINLAKGDYIAFIDSDDYIKKTYLSELISCTSEKAYDIIMSGMTTEKNNTTVYSQYLQKKEMSAREYQYYVLSREIPIFLFQTTCAKLYKRNLIINTKCLFDEDIKISVDSLFNTELLSKLSEQTTIKTIPYQGYVYRWDNTFSIQRSKKTFIKAEHGITAAMKTLIIRKKLYDLYFSNSNVVNIGIQKAFAIVSISNAQIIETNYFSNAERKELYNKYINSISYNISDALNDYKYSDKLILKATMKKAPKLIHNIYKARKIKSKILN